LRDATTSTNLHEKERRERENESGEGERKGGSLLAKGKGKAAAAQAPQAQELLPSPLQTLWGQMMSLEAWRKRTREYVDEKQKSGRSGTGVACEDDEQEGGPVSGGDGDREEGTSGVTSVRYLATSSLGASVTYPDVCVKVCNSGMVDGSQDASEVLVRALRMEVRERSCLRQGCCVRHSLGFRRQGERGMMCV